MEFEDNNYIDNIISNQNIYQNKYLDNLYELYLHFYFITTFEIIFYFYYIVDIEKKMITESLNEFGIFIKNFIYNINDDSIDNLNNYCQDFNTYWEYKPNQLLKDNSIWFIFINSIGIIVITFIYYIQYNSIQKIIYHIYKSTLFILIIIIFEYIFFNLIVLNYNIIDNYQSTCIIINQLT